MSKDVVFPKSGTSGKFPLGVIVGGSFPDNYPDGAPDWPAKDGQVASDKKTKEELKPKPGKLVLIGCGQMFNDSMMAANLPHVGLFANIIDGLSLGDDVVQIRSKTLANRDIKKMTDAQKGGVAVFYDRIGPGLMGGLQFYTPFFAAQRETVLFDSAGAIGVNK